MAVRGDVLTQCLCQVANADARSEPPHGRYLVQVSCRIDLVLWGIGLVDQTTKDVVICGVMKYVIYYKSFKAIAS